MKYLIRAYSKDDNSMHDIKEHKIIHGDLIMTSTYNNLELSLDDTDYVVINSLLLKSLINDDVNVNNLNTPIQAKTRQSRKEKSEFSD